MDEPSWQRRAEEQEAADRAAVERFARDAEQRQRWNQAEGDPLFTDPFDDGRAGLADSARPYVYYYLAVGAVILCAMLLGILRSCFG